MTQTAQSLSTDANTQIVEALNQCKAETVVTTMLAQNFHWNVTGMAFGPLHDLFQSIYEDHFSGQDDLAERIKALDGHAEAVLADMIKRSKVAECDGTPRRRADDPPSEGSRGNPGRNPCGSRRIGRETRRRVDRGPVHRTRSDAREIRLDAARPSAVK